MKRNLLKKTIMGLATASQIFGCAKTAQTTTVASGLAMTGSSKAATVAKYNGKSLLSILLPKANALTAPAGMVDSTGLAIALSSAWVSIKEVEFEADEVKGAAETSGSEVSFHGPYFVDLLSNSPVALDTQQIAQIPYHRIKVQLHASGGALPLGAPSQLSSNSVVIAGTAGVNNFQFRLDDSTEMNIGGANSVVPADGGRLLIEINFADIFKQINMSSIVNNEVISASNRHATTCPSIDASATDVYTCVRKALEKRGNFGEDRNSDGALEVGEESVK